MLRDESGQTNSVFRMQSGVHSIRFNKHSSRVEPWIWRTGGGAFIIELLLSTDVKSYSWRAVGKYFWIAPHYDFCYHTDYEKHQHNIEFVLPTEVKELLSGKHQMKDPIRFFVAGSLIGKEFKNRTASHSSVCLIRKRQQQNRLLITPNRNWCLWRRRLFHHRTYPNVWEYNIKCNYLLFSTGLSGLRQNTNIVPCVFAVLHRARHETAPHHRDLLLPCLPSS